MQTTVTKEFSFDAAHHLTKYYGKCERPHGHTYKLLVTVSGEVAPNGLLIDFVILKRVVNKHIINFLDHHDLNELLENPTSELIAEWIWTKLEPIEQLLIEELEDPNLDQEIKKYLAEDGTLEKTNNRIALEKIVLFETATSSVTISR